jgi:hypothetical protein
MAAIGHAAARPRKPDHLDRRSTGCVTGRISNGTLSW